MDLKAFASAITQITEDKGISEEKVVETIGLALAAAYKRDYGKRGQNVRVEFDPKTGKMKVFQVLDVVEPAMLYTEEELLAMEEEAQQQRALGLPRPPVAVKTEKDEEVVEEKEKIRFNEDRHMLIEDAKKIKKGIQVGETLEIPLEPHEEFGRIAAQTAKQVIIQRIREAEREAIFNEFSARVGEIISGIVQRIEGRTVFADLGRTVGVLFPQDQIPREYYRIGQRIRVYVAEVNLTPKGPQVVLSRSHPKMVSKLFELEVPEIASGSVVIEAIAREPGSRTKVAVASHAEGVDPIGACVGQRGTRVTTVIGEIGGEKIDVIQWDQDPSRFVANALAPAKVTNVDLTERSTAIVTVPDDQLSLAIGKEGQNVRLAAKLTGWRIDVRGEGGEAPVEGKSSILKEGVAEEGGTPGAEMQPPQAEEVQAIQPKEGEERMTPAGEEALTQATQDKVPAKKKKPPSREKKKAKTETTKKSVAKKAGKKET